MLSYVCNIKVDQVLDKFNTPYFLMESLVLINVDSKLSQGDEMSNEAVFQYVSPWPDTPL